MSMNTNVYIQPVSYEPKITNFATPAQDTVSAVNADYSFYGNFNDTTTPSVMRQNKINRQIQLNKIYATNDGGSSIAGGGNYNSVSYSFGSNAPSPSGYQHYINAYGRNSNMCIPEKNL